MKIGNAIRLCRTRRRISQIDLAKRTGLSASFMSMLENDKRDLTMRNVEKIAETLNVPVWALIHLALEHDELTALDPALSGRISLAALEILSAPMEP